MRDIVLEFARDVAEAMPIMGPIVEIGSRVAEGQEHLDLVRASFPSEHYIGCDLQPGPNVDRVEDVHALSFDDDSVGTVLSLDTLEHVADPIRAVQEMQRILRPGGVIAIASVMFFPIHSHPFDYWRFTPEAFDLLLQPFETRLSFGYGWDLMPEGVFGVAVNGPARPLERSQLPRIDAACRAWGVGRTVGLGPIRLTLRSLWTLAARETWISARRRLGPRREPGSDASHRPSAPS